MMALLASPALSQEGGLGLTASLLGVFPSGQFDKTAGPGFGGLGGLELSQDGFGVSVRAGYIQLGEQDDRSLSFVPVLGGVKLSTEDGAVYLAGEMGAIFTRYDFTGNGLLGEDSKATHPGWGVGLGSSPGPLDLRFSFNVWNARKMQESMSLSVSLGVLIR
jgi:hypothetical protein